MELKNKEKRKLLRDIKYQSAELRETGDVQSNSQVILIIRKYKNPSLAQSGRSLRMIRRYVDDHESN